MSNDEFIILPVYWKCRSVVKPPPESSPPRKFVPEVQWKVIPISRSPNQLGWPIPATESTNAEEKRSAPFRSQHLLVSSTPLKIESGSVPAARLCGRERSHVIGW